MSSAMKILHHFPLSGTEVLALLGASTSVGFIGTGLGLDGRTAILLSIFTFALCLVLWAQTRIWQDFRFRYRLRELKRNQEGDEVIPAIRRAKTQLLLTHGSRFVPTEGYTQEVCAAIRRRLRVSRIVPKTLLDDPHLSGWLDQFNKANAHGNYRLYQAALPELATSFAVIDRQYVFLWLPGGAEGSNHAEYIAEFENNELARIFESIFEQLKVRFVDEDS